jgi:outer membrane protein
MKKLLICIFVLALAPAVMAGEGLKIAVMDFQAALNESEYGKKTRETLEEEIRKRQIKIDKQIQKRDKMKNELDSQASVLSEEAFRARADELDKFEKELERLVNDSNEEFAKLQRQKEVSILSELDALVRQMAEKEGYDLVFPVDVVVYSVEGLDITKQVIKRYNEMKKAETPGEGK